ncbi:MAG: DegV family protein [Actinobacteria bacterium]|nr:DegV family protein [Actinomycetota bacterium]
MAINCGIVVDSTFDLPIDFYKTNNIEVVYLRSIFSDEEVYKEHLEISPAQFYEKLKSAKKLPTTSQPPVGEFLEIYSRCLEKYDFILSLHLPETLSGTMNSARTAADEIDGEIYVKSTMSVSIGSAQILEQVLRLREEENDKKRFLEKVDELVDNQFLLGMLPTLDYLEKGGRIGKAQALLGSLLDFKPLLAVKDGVVIPLGRARGEKKGFKELAEHIENFASGSKVSLLFGYGEIPEKTEKFREYLKTTEIDFVDKGIVQIGPVIGTYLGPEVIMVSVLKIA